MLLYPKEAIGLGNHLPDILILKPVGHLRNCRQKIEIKKNCKFSLDKARKNKEAENRQ